MEPNDRSLFAPFKALTEAEQLQITSALSLHFGEPIAVTEADLSKRSHDEVEIIKNVISGWILTKNARPDIAEAHERLKDTKLPHIVSFGRSDDGQDPFRVGLVRADIQDAPLIHEMQVSAFTPLLRKYEDFDTNPANETVARIVERLNQPFTEYYLIVLSTLPVGAIRIVNEQNKTYRVSPIFLMPEYQGRGIAQIVFALIERQYADAAKWALATIRQEAGLCYLYEKLGYRLTEGSKVINDKMKIVFL
ncbi:GNAT family N-acetyltransferase [Cohnella rhizosphaerae]|uniref:GNAT family N-acetyltransferase n=1 Tax=Cohnella rhizosphaerae TaxID=1457232 RepID=A0A9X4KYS0_9BACL|nr:GNAT family N-acetyltransferase [Cohnella rhizosphaerae]MDG0813305.1 GNAT family N-acetyltransferase [Cohnella rhizosphaerae]